MFAENLVWKFDDETSVDAEVEVDMAQVMKRTEVLDTSRLACIHLPLYSRHH
jgi:hypothetical protein